MEDLLLDNKLKYSVIIPVFNSSEIIEELVSRLIIVMDDLKEPYEIICVDDCSEDSSWETLKHLKVTWDSKLKIILLAKNFGQHNATLCGMRLANGIFSVTLDDDLQHQPEDIPNLLNEIENRKLDIIYGIPITENHKSNFRRISGNIWNKGTNNFDDGLGKGSSFRVLKKTLVNDIVSHQHHFIYIDEILNWYTDSIGMCTVNFKKSKRKKSSYGISKLFLLSTNLALFYSSFPLKLITYGGLIMSIISFSLGFFYFLKKIIFGIGAPGFTAIIVSIFFSTSLILTCLGIVGQYLGKIHAALNKKPTYSIKEKYL